MDGDKVKFGWHLISLLFYKYNIIEVHLPSYSKSAPISHTVGICMPSSLQYDSTVEYINKFD